MSTVFLLMSLVGMVVGYPRCETYTGTVCGFVVDKYERRNGIYAQSSITVTIAEEILKNEFVNLTLVGPAALPRCFLAASKFFCSDNFPACDNSSQSQPAPVKACRSVCEEFVKECKESFELIGKGSLVPQCSSYVEEGNCEKMDSVQIPSEYIKCNAPLVANPDMNIISTNCPGHCCIPCPLLEKFYPENSYNRLIIVLYVFSALSFFGCLFVFVSYAVLPGKRKFPQSVILSMSFTGLIIFTGTWMSIFAGQKKAHCYDEVREIGPGKVNPICSAQGSFVLYGVLLAATWFGLLVINIHMNVVWKNQKLGDYSKVYHSIFWLWPIAFLVPLNYYELFTYATGLWCAPYIGIWIQVFLLIPLAIIIYPSFLLNLATLAIIFKVARERNAKIKTILKIQLRPFFFCFAVITILISYWIYAQSIQGNSPEKISLWLYEWFVCIQKGGTQNECSVHARGHLPPLGGFFIAEVLVHSIGIIIFIFFGLKKDIYREWLIFFGLANLSSFSNGGSLSSYSNEKTISHVEKTIQELSPNKNSPSFDLEDRN